MRLVPYIYFLVIPIFFASCATNRVTRDSDSCGCEVAQSTKPAKVDLGEPVGTYLDKPQQKKLRSSPKTLQRIERGEPLTIDDVIKLHNGGVGDQILMRYIHVSKASYSLTETQIRRLRNSGISGELVDAMRRKES